MKRVILFGGSFDPVHNGHLRMAQEALKQRQADALWFVVSQQNPFKERGSSFAHRAKMCQIITHYHRKMSVCTIEATMPAPSYTIDTVRLLRRKFPDIEFEWLMGSDQLPRFRDWKGSDVLPQEIQMLVYRRDTEILPEHAFIEIVGPLFPVSSTAIREGGSTDTHPNVLTYMMRHNLYTTEILEHRLSQARYDHVLRVASLALELGKKHHVAEDSLKTAALMHDATKELEKSQQKTAMQQTGYPLSVHPALYHGYTAAGLLSKVYYFKDRAVLRAIRSHVSGESTSRLGKILYIADKCERGRDYDSEPLIQLALADLDKGFKKVKQEQENYIKGV